MSEPLAFFLTWMTYGTWLPGDERGWGDDRLRRAALALRRVAEVTLSQSSVVLMKTQQSIVVQSVRESKDG
ncbi:MAG: hypothetical protein KDA86_00045 [Planctomycetaceae bacterium]|nr:hypothetical protein [Planctomycetaceae bacterium]